MHNTLNIDDINVIHCKTHLNKGDILQVANMHCIHDDLILPCWCCSCSTGNVAPGLSLQLANLVLGGMTKNVYHGIFQNSNSFTVCDGISFSCIIRCSQHFLLVERGITGPFKIEKVEHLLHSCPLPLCLSKREV